MRPARQRPVIFSAFRDFLRLNTAAIASAELSWYNPAIMEPGTAAASQATKILSAAKDWPLWLFTAAALSLFTLVFLFADLLSDQTRRWIEAAATGLGIFAVCRLGNTATTNFKTYRARVAARHTFHLTPVPQRCHWGATRQQDGTMTTQIAVSLIAKNLTQYALHLLRVRLIKPKISGEVLGEMLLVSRTDSPGNMVLLTLAPTFHPAQFASLR